MSPTLIGNTPFEFQFPNNTDQRFRKSCQFEFSMLPQNTLVNQRKSWKVRFFHKNSIWVAHGRSVFLLSTATLIILDQQMPTSKTHVRYHDLSSWFVDVMWFSGLNIPTGAGTSRFQFAQQPALVPMLAPGSVQGFTIHPLQARQGFLFILSYTGLGFKQVCPWGSETI